jgi:hypothetical protein
LGAKGIHKRVYTGVYRGPLNTCDGVRGTRFDGKGDFVLVIAVVVVHTGCFNHGSPHAVFDVIRLEMHHESTQEEDQDKHCFQR